MKLYVIRDGEEWSQAEDVDSIWMRFTFEACCDAVKRVMEREMTELAREEPDGTHQRIMRVSRHPDGAGFKKMWISSKMEPRVRVGGL